MALLVLQTLVGFYVSSYAARCFLLVVEETAAGNDEVLWTHEPIVDWFWKFFYVLWLIAFWLVPAWFLVIVLKMPALSFLVIAVGLVWLFFPVSLLSSLSANSPWVVLRPALLGRTVQRLGSVVAFYASTALLLAGIAGLCCIVLTLSWMFLLLPVAALAGAAG